jgi:hypothetical protein
MLWNLGDFEVLVICLFDSCLLKGLLWYLSGCLN